MATSVTSLLVRYFQIRGKMRGRTRGSSVLAQLANRQALYAWAWVLSGLEEETGSERLLIRVLKVRIDGDILIS